jgi:hypothetical protein
MSALSSTVSQGNNASSWSIYPILIFLSKLISPLYSWSRPDIKFNIELLPHPDGPIIPINSFLFISNDTPSIAFIFAFFRVIYF